MITNIIGQFTKTNYFAWINYNNNIQNIQQDFVEYNSIEHNTNKIIFAHENKNRNNLIWLIGL